MSKLRRDILVLLFVLMGLYAGNALAELSRDEIISQTAKWFSHDGFHHSFEATGKEFILKDNPLFPNLTVTSTEEITINIEAVTNTLSFIIVPLTGTLATETVITISGLEPFWQDKTGPIPLYRHHDGWFREEFTVDADGRHSFLHPLDNNHHISILPYRGTLHITGDTYPPGTVVKLRDLPHFQDPAHYGEYYGEVHVDCDGVIIDGEGTSIIGAGAGYGIYLGYPGEWGTRSGVTVRNCSVANWAYGIYSVGSWYCTFSNNKLFSNTTYGLRLGNASWWNTISGNEIYSNWLHGISISPNCQYNEIKDYNYIHDNASAGLAFGNQCYNNKVISNTITSNGWFGISSEYYSWDNTATGNTITGSYYGVACWPYGYAPFVKVYKNNIYGNSVYNYHSEDTIYRELCRVNPVTGKKEGNYWGHDTLPGFTPGVDATMINNIAYLNDPAPYLRENGWNYGDPGVGDDPTPPTGAIVINGQSAPGQLYTSNPIVNIYVTSVVDNAPSYYPLQVRFSNTEAGLEGATWIQVPDTLPALLYPNWQLPAPASEGNKTVYAQFRNQNGVKSGPRTDDIFLDLSGATGSISINSGAPYANSYSGTISFSASDQPSGVIRMRFRNPDWYTTIFGRRYDRWSTWEPYYPGSKSWTFSPAGDGTKVVYAQYENGAGLTANYWDSITLDTTAPDTSIISVSPDPTKIINPTVRATVTDSATPITRAEYFLDGSNPDPGNASPMSSEDGAFDETSETVSAVINISALYAGPHTVYVRCKDAAGNWDTTPASWIFTTTNRPPAVPASPLPADNAWVTANPWLSVEISEPDGDSGRAYFVVTNVTTGQVFQGFGNTVANGQRSSWQPSPSLSDGTYRWKACAGDIYDFWSAYSQPEWTVKKDSAAPQINFNLSPLANADGWNNTDVTVTFSASDPSPGSGIKTYSAPTTLTGDGANQTVIGVATDNAGNSASTTATVNIDKTPPNISNITITPDLANGNSVTINAQAIDAKCNIVAVEFYGDWAPGVWIPMSASDGSFNSLNEIAQGTINISGVSPDGLHTVYIRAKDLAGNWTTPVATKTFTIDRTAPNISNITIAPDPANGNSVTINAQAIDAKCNIVAVEFYGDWVSPVPSAGSATQMSATDGSFNSLNETAQGTINIAIVSEGLHTVYIRAKDLAGNWTTPVATKTFTIDRTAPNISNITIAPDPANGNSVTINAQAIDARYNIVAVEFYGDWVSPVPSAGSATQMSATDGSFNSLNETAQGTINITGVSEGLHTVYIRAKDLAGNWTTPVATKTFTIDRTEPNINSITITPDPTKTNPEILAPAQDATSNIAAVEFYGDWVSPAPAPGAGTQMGAADGSFNSTNETGKLTINIASLSEGIHTVWVRAKDRAGNWTTLVVTKTFTIDRTAPNVSGITITPDPTKTNPEISALAQDATSNIVAVEFYGDWVLPSPALGSATQMSATDGSFNSANETAQGTINITGVSEGLHTVYIRAKDLAGNWTTPVATKTFTIDRTAPNISNITITPDPTNGNPQISALATDTKCNIVAVEFYGDWVSPVPAPGAGTAMSAVDGAFNSKNETAQGTINITGVSEVPHTVYIRAKDLAGNWTTPLAIKTFTIDRTAPSINLATATPPTPTNERRPVISVQYSDTGSGIDTAGVQMTVDGGSVTPQTINASDVSYTTSADLAYGEHTIVVTVKDNAGNITNAIDGTWKFTVNKPPNPPALQSPDNNIWVNYDPTLTVQVSDDDVGDSMQVYFEIDGMTSGWIPATPVSNNSMVSWTPSLSNGTYTWKAKARDNHDLEGNWSIETWTVNKDTSPPAISSITSNTAGSGNGIAVPPGGLTIQIVFNETMNTAYPPTITYDPTGVIGPQPCGSGTWSTTTYTNDTYTVTNTNEINVSTGDGVAQVSISGGQDLAGNPFAGGTSTFVINIKPFKIENVVSVPAVFNPLFETTTISYVLSEPAASLTFTLADSVGTIVRTFTANQPKNAGFNYEIWDGKYDPPDPNYVPNGQYDIKINALSYANEAGMPTGSPTVTVDYTFPVINDLSIPTLPELFYPGTLQIGFNTSIPMDIKVWLEHTDAIGIITTITDKDFLNTSGNSVIWDGTNAPGFVGSGTQMPDGLYSYGIKQIPIENATRRTGTIVLVRNNTALSSSSDMMGSVRYNPATPGIGTISVNAVDPSLLDEQSKAIATADPPVYIIGNVYEVKANPPVTFPADSPAILVFKYDASITGDVSKTLRLRRWDTSLPTPVWVDVVPQYVDLVNKQIIAQVTSFSLFAIFYGADTTPPVITVTSPQDGQEYYSIADGQPTIIPIAYIAEDPVINEVTSGITYTKVTLNGQVYADDTIDLTNLLGENTLIITAIDRSGNFSSKTVRFTVVLPAVVTVKPESLHINGGVMTVFVQFPAGYDVAAITDAFCDGARYESMALEPDGARMAIKFRRANLSEPVDAAFEIRGAFQFNQKSCIFKGTDGNKKVLDGSAPPATTTNTTPDTTVTPVVETSSSSSGSSGSSGGDTTPQNNSGGNNNQNLPGQDNKSGKKK